MEMIYEHSIASIELTGEFEKKLNEVADGGDLQSLLWRNLKHSHTIFLA